jgi:hypothetical protein
VKSIGQIDVGNIFLTHEYNGSIIEAKNWGLHFKPSSCNHDKITSANTKYWISSRNVYIAKVKFIFISLFYYINLKQQLPGLFSYLIKFKFILVYHLNKLILQIFYYDLVMILNEFDT